MTATPEMVYVSHPTEYGTDVTLKDIAALCDIFYIGGTKVGALFGEAVVFTRPGMVKQFDTIVKQRGVLLAKGRLLGLQFDTLFTDDLYIRIASHAIDMADRIVRALREKGYKFLIEPETNQLFVIMENKHLEELSKTIGVEVWEKVDENTQPCVLPPAELLVKKTWMCLSVSCNFSKQQT